MLALIKKDGVFWGCCLLAAAMPFFMTPGNLAIIVLLVLWLVGGEFKEKASKLKHNVPFWLVLIFFSLHVVALSYTDNLSAGLFAIEKKLPLLVLTIIIFSSAFEKKQINRILGVFAFATTVAALILLGIFFYRLCTSLGDCQNCYYHDFTKPIGFHAVYFSYFSFFAFLFYSGRLRDRMKSGTLIGTILSLLVLSIAILVASSKLVLLVLILFVAFITAYLLFHLKTPSLRLLIASFLAISVVFISLVFFIQPIKDRFTEALDLSSQSHYAIVGTNQQLSNNEKRELTGLTLRVLLWKLGAHELQEHKNLLLGFSPGDAGTYMNKAYVKHNMAPMWFEDYNMHNQYVQTLLELGIVGLLSLLLMLVYPMIFRGHVYSEFLLFSFTCLISLAFMSEVLMGLNKGIVFIAFFYSLLNKKSV